MEITNFRDFEMILHEAESLKVDKTSEFSGREKIWNNFYNAFKDGDHEDMLGMKIEIYFGKIFYDYIYFGKKRKKQIGQLKLVKIYDENESLFIGYVPIMESQAFATARRELIRVSSLDFYEKILTAAKLYF